jgi:hypothetical protein
MTSTDLDLAPTRALAASASDEKLVQAEATQAAFHEKEIRAMGEAAAVIVNEVRSAFGRQDPIGGFEGARAVLAALAEVETVAEWRRARYRRMVADYDRAASRVDSVRVAAEILREERLRRNATGSWERRLTLVGN